MDTLNPYFHAGFRGGLRSEFGPQYSFLLYSLHFNVKFNMEVYGDWLAIGTCPQVAARGAAAFRTSCGGLVNNVARSRSIWGERSIKVEPDLTLIPLSLTWSRQLLWEWKWLQAVPKLWGSAEAHSDPSPLLIWLTELIKTNCRWWLCTHTHTHTSIWQQLHLFLLLLYSS